MAGKNRTFMKLLLIIVGTLIIGYIFAVSIRMNRTVQPEGEYIRLQDALILTEAMDEGFGERFAGDGRYREWQETVETDSGSILTYGQFEDLMEMLQLRLEETREEEKGAQEGTLEADSGEEGYTAAIEDLYKGYEEKYKADFAFLQEDWYEMYGELLACFGMEEIIRQGNVTVLGCGGEVTERDGNALGEDMLLTMDGVYAYYSDAFPGNKYQVLTVYQKEGTLLTVLGVVSRGMDLENVWVMEAEPEEGLWAFYKGYEIYFPYGRAESGQREQVGDFGFADGALQSVKVKGEKISGKLLRIGDGQIEIEGAGEYPYKEGMAVYKLYGELREGDERELRIGYDYTDFVLEDGIICAGLVTRDEAMEDIRVLIKSTGFGGVYHEKVELTADIAFTLRYGEPDRMESREYQPGEVVTLDGEGEFFTGDRVFVEPAALTGRIRLLSVERTQGNPEYRGKMEIEKTAEGLVVINEVLLEEYLYSVVPSEMPASYPLEALKAQAVSARTYAYQRMLHPGARRFGAHLDDSTVYQVYNNIAENAQSTKAVRETAGSLLYCGEELCDAYYYSTSCGFGTDAHIWGMGSSEEAGYLQAKRIGEAEGEYTQAEMMEEENFDSFIHNVYPSDYENGDAWYRWTYESKEADAGRLLAAMQARYEAGENLVLTQNEEGEFESRPIKRLGDVKDIFIEKRGNGGVADELVIVGSEHTFKVLTEHNIRYVLNNGVSKVVRQDGSQVSSPSLLPSGHFTITTSKKDGIVVGYTLSGGGFGHGVGMSQNGAREMAKKGFSFHDILAFFYQSCEIRNVY